MPSEQKVSILGFEGVWRLTFESHFDFSRVIIMCPNISLGIAMWASEKSLSTLWNLKMPPRTHDHMLRLFSSPLFFLLFLKDLTESHFAKVIFHFFLRWGSRFWGEVQLHFLRALSTWISQATHAVELLFFSWATWKSTFWFNHEISGISQVYERLWLYSLSSLLRLWRWY